MIFSARGNILLSDADLLCCPVNLRGVMGKGLAKSFAERFPSEARAYKAACLSGELREGRVLVVGRVVMVPTKRDWRDPSPPELVRASVQALRELSGSMAIPQLGCGLGGLEWSLVREMIEQELASREGVTLVFGEGWPEIGLL